MIAPDVGGGFGSKLNVYAEEALCLAVARKLGTPVKWIEERSEAYVATIHGRGVIQDIELAATEEGKLRGVRVKLLADMGAYYQLVSPGIPLLGAFLYGGVYDIEGYHFECTGVLTNKTPTDAYRGAGRPEATYAIERAMDALAHRVGKDPAEIRRMNYIAPFDEPHAIAAGLQLDSGNFVGGLDRALEMVGYESLRAEQRKRRESGDRKQLGIGLSTYIEMCGLAPSQVLGRAQLRRRRLGRGGRPLPSDREGDRRHRHLAARAGPRDDVGADHRRQARRRRSRTSTCCTATRPSRRSGWTRTAAAASSVGGVALWYATEKVLAKARLIAAHELEVADADLEWTDGAFRVKGAPDRSKTIPEIALLRVDGARAAGGRRAEPRGDVRLGPAELHVPVGHARLRGRGRHGDRRDARSSATSPSTTAAR